MSKAIKTIPCGVSRCEATHKYQELLPEFEQLKKEKDKLTKDMESFKKILENDKSTESERKKIIVENVELNNLCLMRQEEIDHLHLENEILHTKLEETDKLLKKKTSEILSIESEYDKNVKIQELDEEIKDKEKQLTKTIFEVEKAQKIKERIRLEIEKFQKDFNKKVDEYNEIIDRSKDLPKAKTWRSAVFGSRWEKNE